MRHYLDYYFDLYWDLHLGVKGDAIPPRGARDRRGLQHGARLPQSAAADHLRKLYERASASTFLNRGSTSASTISQSGKIKNPEKTIAYYWLKNAGDGSHFSKKDVVFECFHNFVALSQWGNSIFGIMSRLAEDGGDQAVRAAFQKTMSGNFDNASGAPFTPLELLVMEFFRTISPNGGSISAIRTRAPAPTARSPRTVRRALRAALLHEHAAYQHELRSRSTGRIRTRSIRNAI